MQCLRSGLGEFLVTVGFQVHGLSISRRTHFIQFNGMNCFQFTWPAQYGVVSGPERRYYSILTTRLSQLSQFVKHHSVNHSCNLSEKYFSWLPKMIYHLAKTYPRSLQHLGRLTFSLTGHDVSSQTSSTFSPTRKHSSRGFAVLKRDMKKYTKYALAKSTQHVYKIGHKNISDLVKSTNMHLCH